jgi:putative toxin-antitoxin system antitoxin component (TIGR02293 family)
MCYHLVHIIYPNGETMNKPAGKVVRKAAVPAAKIVRAGPLAKTTVAGDMATAASAIRIRKPPLLRKVEVVSQPTGSHAHAAAPKRDPKLGFAQLSEMDGLARDKAVRAGLPVGLLDEAAHTVGVSQAALLGALGIATSTASRRKASGEPLSVEESDRIARLARLWRDVMVVFEDEEGAKAWLNGHVPVLGAVPLQLLATSDGFEQARTAIQRLAHGVYS